jgi:RND family efflux transporter MFP subunit
VNDRLSSDLASLKIERDAPAVGGSSLARRVLVPLVVVGALGAAGFLAWEKIEAQVFKQEMATSEVAIISPSQAEVTVTATGYVIPQRTSKVGSKIPGRLAKVNVKEGDDVKEGDVIAQLDDADARTQIVAAGSRVGVAQARVATARANLAELTQQVNREKKLVASGAVGRANLDDLVAREAALKEAVSAAEAEARAAQADVGTYGVGLKDRLVIAPISGRIVTKPATVGEFVGGIGNMTNIAEIVDFDSLMVETDVPEARLHLVKLGGPCEIVLDAYPNKRYRGVAKELGLRVNRQKATVVVKVKFSDDTTGVLPEMSARVSFLSKAITDEALKEQPKKVVPADAVTDRGGQKVIFTVESGKLHMFPVKVGQSMGASVELLDGPPPGTKIVAKPLADTSDGQRIKETDK